MPFSLPFLASGEPAVLATLHELFPPADQAFGLLNTYGEFQAVRH